MADTEKRRRHASQTLEAGNAAEIEQQENELDLLELFYYLLEHWKHLVAAAVACGVIMALISLFILTPKYEQRPSSTSCRAPIRPSTFRSADRFLPDL